MRLDLRAKILLLTALPLAALTAASLWLVHRDVSQRTASALRGDLGRAADLFERMLADRTARLDATGAVIVRDPKFFAVLALPHVQGDRQFESTVAGVAADFEALAHPDVFEVVDDHGRVVASVGALALDPVVRAALRPDGLAGRTTHRAVALGGTHVLLVSTPVVAGGRVVGALLLGTEVGSALAADLRELTQSDVTLLRSGRVTRSTFTRAEDRAAARDLASRPDGVVRTWSAGHDRWLGLARPLPLGAEGDGQVYVLQRSFEAETAFLRDVRAHLVALGGLTLLALALVSAVIATRLARPIRQLVDAAEAMEHGRWDAPLDRGRGDELGALANRFDQMRRRQRVYVERLEEVARARSEFIAIASHELRTPIAIIEGWRDLLGTGELLPPDPRFDTALEAIGHACTTLERIAVDATRMAEAEAQDATASRARCDVTEMLEGVAREVRAAALDRDVRLEVAVEPAAAWAWIDGPALARALDALARNGVRFTPDGGRVRLEARALGAALRLGVSDTGIGLTAEASARLAELPIAPRESAHHHTGRGLEFNRPGLGFGLALVRRVAEAHGGTLRIAGEPGRGSTFALDLPDALASGQLAEAA